MIGQVEIDKINQIDEQSTFAMVTMDICVHR
jgi:hypothetical protein